MIPYPGPCLDREVQDIVIYLRPETNGVKTESCMLKVLREDPEYKDLFQLVYLANLPGDFIVEHQIVEEHYASQIRFAKDGRAAFTSAMRRGFEEYFSVPFERADIIGSYEALGRLGFSEEELFGAWVDEKAFTHLQGQSVKKIHDVYVVNYDIPAVLHRNSKETDSFAMILRCFTDYTQIHRLILEMGRAVQAEGMLSGKGPISRAFHYSKGPFEQILDGIGYIYDKQDQHADLEELSFFRYLRVRGFSREMILDVVQQPIRVFRIGREVVEKNIFDYTYESSYREAAETLGEMVR